MAQAAGAYKPAPSGKAEPNRHAPGAEAAPGAGTPAFLGGPARMTGGAPPYLQRQPTPIEPDEEPGEGEEEGSDELGHGDLHSVACDPARAPSNRTPHWNV